MTLKKLRQAKVVAFGWGNELKGENVSLQVHGQEKRSVKNDGEANLFFDDDFSGNVSVVVADSHGNEVPGTIHVN